MGCLDRASVLRLMHALPLLQSSTPDLPELQSACRPLALEEAAAIILSQCDPAFVSAVRDTGRMLYRGEGLTAAAKCTPHPDLLEPKTYGEPDALDFFRRLEDSLPPAVGARPSMGHIGTSSVEAAGAWGAAASIWPLGRLTYAWPSDRPEFWPVPGDASEADQASVWCLDEQVHMTDPNVPLITRFPHARFPMRHDDIVIDRGLRRALVLSHEVGRRTIFRLCWDHLRARPLWGRVQILVVENLSSIAYHLAGALCYLFEVHIHRRSRNERRGSAPHATTPWRPPSR